MIKKRLYYTLLSGLFAISAAYCTETNEEMAERICRPWMVARAELPPYLQDQPDPLPFYRGVRSYNLVWLNIRYYAGLTYDTPEGRQQAQQTYEAGLKLIEEKNNEDGVRMLYQAGWLMGHPGAVQYLKKFFGSQKGAGAQKLTLVFSLYPKTDEAVITEIKECRKALAGDEDESSEDESPAGSSDSSVQRAELAQEGASDDSFTDLRAVGVPLLNKKQQEETTGGLRRRRPFSQTL